MNTRSLLDNISPANFILLLASQLRKLAFEDRCSVVDFFLFMKFKGGHLTPLQIVARSPSILRGAAATWSRYFLAPYGIGGYAMVDRKTSQVKAIR